jgi:hypothetical protein
VNTASDMPPAEQCPGPLIWRDVGLSEDGLGAVLECAAPDCGYFMATGSPYDQAHRETPLLREGLTAN